MRIEEIRTLTTQGLHEELDKAQKELFSLRFQKATRQLADSSQIPKIRKDVARIKTILQEQETV